MNLKIISAGAGSGKTYRLTQEMVALLKSGVRPSGIIATTFTNKAAAELQERVRIKLLEEGLSQQANELSNALIGTVHSLGVKLLKRFAFEAGVSPEVDIIADEDQQILFNKSLATVLTGERIQKMETLSLQLGFYKSDRIDWRKSVKQLSDLARANDFNQEVIEESKINSFETFSAFLEKKDTKTNFTEELKRHIKETSERLDANEDQTKVTAGAIAELRKVSQQLKLNDNLPWFLWAKVSKLKVGAKSKDDVEALQLFAASHIAHPQFHEDIQAYIYGIFDIASAALTEYEAYKKQRGLIDYIDMEIQVRMLLQDPHVRDILSNELDLLMVDEFQDTNPIQLDIFLKLSHLAKHSVWVGDPKQSIYGFRGADPKLMLAIMKDNGGVKPEDIQEHSWRSREDIVNLTNALFCKAFPALKTEQIALKAKRKKIASKDSINKTNEPIEVGDAIVHWHFESEGKRSSQDWFNNCIAIGIKKLLARETLILPKDETEYRKVLPGDIAILCRTNAKCLALAESLHRQGLKAAVARNGLLETAEAKLILACLKYILNQTDSLSVAEILLLATPIQIEEIIDDRLQFLDKHPDDYRHKNWAGKEAIIERINGFREKVLEFSSAELLNYILEDLDLRRIISKWGNVSQRMANIDVLRKFALHYEEGCNRLHTAASLGGFLLWLNEKAGNTADNQGSGENAQAINILTYHRSKGLEWPVLICHNLESKLNDSLFGVQLIDKNEEPDLDDLLGNRWIRYWINPYADQNRGTTLMAAMEESEAQKATKSRALQEEARLLYVGITRARDYLIFPTRSTKPAWLNRVWHNGENEDQILDASNSETPWEWEGKIIMKETEVEMVPSQIPHSEVTEDSILYISERKGQQEFENLFIAYKNESSIDNVQIKLVKQHSYGSDLASEDRELQQQLSQAFQKYFTGFSIQLSQVKKAEMAALQLEKNLLSDELESDLLAQQAEGFYQLIQKEHAPIAIKKNYPIQSEFQKRFFQTKFDLLLEADKEVILIQNANTGSSKKEMESYCKKQLDFVYYASESLKAIYKKKIRAFINFPVKGLMIELVILKSSRK